MIRSNIGREQVGHCQWLSMNIYIYINSWPKMSVQQEKNTDSEIHLLISQAVRRHQKPRGKEGNPSIMRRKGVQTPTSSPADQYIGVMTGRSV